MHWTHEYILFPIEEEAVWSDLWFSVLDLKSGDPKFKSQSDYNQLEFINSIGSFWFNSLAVFVIGILNYNEASYFHLFSDSALTQQITPVPVMILVVPME